MLEVQILIFFTEGNTYYGECAGENDDAGKFMRYRVAPLKEDGQLLASTWREDRCYECAGEKTEARVPMTEEGLEQIKSWLWERWQEIAVPPKPSSQA